MSTQITSRRGLLYCLALVAAALRRRYLVGGKSSIQALLDYLVRAIGVIALYDSATVVQGLLQSRAKPLPAVDHDAYGPPVVRERRSSFTITNEHGESRGSLEDVATGGWSWQVNDEPLSTSSSPPKQPVGRLRRSSRDDSSSSIASSVETPQPEPPTIKRRNSKVRFKVDSGPSFYGFVFDYSGRCVAHGADERFVGLTLAQVMERSKNLSSDGDGEALHRRFVAAAEAGGGWVSYAWRNSPTAALRLKGAYIIKVGMWGRAFYAGVGYSILPPLEAVAAATAAASAVSASDADAAAAAAAVAAVPPPRAAVAEATAGLKQKLLTASTRSGLHRLAGDGGLEGGGELTPGDMHLFDKGEAAGGGKTGGEGEDAYPVGLGGEGDDGGDGGYWYGGRGDKGEKGGGGGGGGGLPAELATVLRDHTLMHIGWLQEGRHNGAAAAAAAAGGQGGDASSEGAPDAAAAPVLSPSVAAQIGYGRRKQSDAPLEGNVAALVGYRRRRNPHVPVQW